MARKSTKTTKHVEREEEQSSNSLFDYLRFGESYTSLILGIIVVIISTVLLLSFVHNRNVEKDTPQLLSQKDINLPSSPIASVTGGKPTNTPAPTKIAQAVKPTIVPTKATTIAPTTAPTKKVDPTNVPTKAAQGSVNPASAQYTVVAGDNLWIISEKQYKSGYNWVDIARANKLSNPGMIAVGQKLTMPKVEQKVITVTTTPAPAQATITPNSTKITADTYTVVKGDTLWTISVRAYGDGYQWTKISSANNLINPNVIHAGNKLKIPRGK